MDKLGFDDLLKAAIATKQWMSKGIYDSRAKDYESSFRKMVYDTKEEMDKVMGKFSENSFINQQEAELEIFKSEIATLKKYFYRKSKK